MSRPNAAPTRWETSYHAPVLVDEVVRFLADARTVLDGTLGGGGHTLALLERGDRATITALDRDPDAVTAASERLAGYVASGRLEIMLGNYADVDAIEALAARRFDGILLDLGVSSWQLDAESRGFSFRPGVPLDMRMDPTATMTAATYLNESDERELIRVFREYADEPRASRLAGEVARRRRTRPFEISDDLVNAIRGALGPKTGPSDFARIFQAVRIVVNDELEGLARALPNLRNRLVPGGTFVVIAYHSGEDRLVKNAFREWSTACVCPPKQPVCTCGGRALGKTLTRRALTASADEQAQNPRSRSARLRAWRSDDA
jgi:16S rRNA (cytosine1402-N4)-methyltransferase